MVRLLTYILFLSFMLPFWGSCRRDDPADILAAELDKNKEITAMVVHTTAVGLGETIRNYFPDSIRAVQYVRTYIDSVRYYDDNSGYFYVYNYQCVNIAHATQKDLQGKDLYNYTDSKGLFVIRELAAAARLGGGFVEFHWIKPGETGEKLKLGYVEPIPGTNWFIGSGVYIPE